MIVVDSSVVVNAVVEGPLTAEVLSSRAKDKRWIAPSLWKSEVRSALTQHVRHGTFSLHEGFQRAVESENLVFETREMRDHHSILTVAVESGCSAYDGEFIALALETGLPLLTYDRKLIDLFPAIALTPGEWLIRTDD